MSLVIIFGPQAVGKMTVGHELEKLTSLKLFHNHMTIELVQPFFDYGSPEGKRLVKLFRNELLQAVAMSNQSGLIFTYIWDFDNKQDWEYIEMVSRWFTDHDKPVYYVELVADVAIRLHRNKTEHRLLHKPSKRNVLWSDTHLLETEKIARMNSREGELTFENYLRIDNAEIEPHAVAQMIKDQFSLI